MKNRMQDVRNHLVAAMEALGDNDVSDAVIARAKVISDLAQTYTNTVKVEIEALRLAGAENRIPEVLEQHPVLPGVEREQLRAKLDELTADRDEIHRALLMTTDERNRGDRELHRLRAQLDEYERAPQPPHVDPDWLSNVIRTVAPHICAERDELAEKIAEAINGRAK